MSCSNGVWCLPFVYNFFCTSNKQTQTSLFLFRKKFALLSQDGKKKCHFLTPALATIRNWILCHCLPLHHCETCIWLCYHLLEVTLRICLFLLLCQSVVVSLQVCQFLCLDWNFFGPYYKLGQMDCFAHCFYWVLVPKSFKDIYLDLAEVALQFVVQNLHFFFLYCLISVHAVFRSVCGNQVWR